jgi:Flp pilus assembly protein protease CpaA
MFLLALLSLSSYIIVRDFLSHRISNFSVILLTALLSHSPSQVELEETIIAMLVVSVLFYIMRIGMGDLKLMLGLLITQGALILSISYLASLLCVLLITLITQLFSRHTLHGSVAFAHVLLVPFLITYLAI